ncbi:UNVERIFIED_CONTAM: hypothetical protein Slati_4219300, partial [Sesamum latifolium]
KRQDKNGFVAVKLDISEAYDRLEQSFVGFTLAKLGFLDAFISVTMLYISSMRFSFLLNEEQFGSIQPQCGVHQ